MKAARRAVALLKARRAPAGQFTVVFHPSITSLLVHEALGHNAEADHVLTGTSILEGKLGDQIAADCVTIIDDGTIPGAWGSYPYDSEGTPSTRRVLIENGVLRGFMHSLETAARMGVAPTGSARADGYACRPIVRMSNTFFVPGAMSLEGLLKGIDEGVYLSAGQFLVTQVFHLFYASGIPARRSRPGTPNPPQPVWRRSQLPDDRLQRRYLAVPPL